MAFSEAVKQSAKRKAHFKCCICQRPSVSLEAHHIISESDGGPDTEDNAAPLCPTCHAEYGANPEKRTAIRVQRDFWYEICERRYVLDSRKLDRIIELLEGDTAKDTGFQEFAIRVTNTDPETHTRTIPASVVIEVPTATAHAEALPPTVISRVDATGKALPREVKVEGSLAHATVTNHDEDEWDEEDFQQEPRTEIEILEALEKLFDQIWYNRHWYHRTEIEEGKAHVTPEIWTMMLAAAARVEEKYKDDSEALGPWSDLEWGMLNGKMSALRWALGDEWDFLDT